MRKIALLFVLVLVLAACSANQKTPSSEADLSQKHGSPEGSWVIDSSEAYLLQKYGSPGGSWVIDSIEPQVELRNLETGASLVTQRQLDESEYPVFVSWSPDGSAFAVFEARYRLGCPLERLAIYTFDGQLLERNVYEPEHIPDDRGCMRAAWSPDSRSIGLVLGPEIIELDKQGGVIQKLPMTFEDEGSSIQTFVWTETGILYVEKIFGDNQRGILHHVEIESKKHKVLFENPGELVLAGTQGRYALIVLSIIVRPEHTINFTLVNVENGDIVNTFTIDKWQYCGSLSSATAPVMMLALGNWKVCSVDVQAYVIDLNDANIQEHGDIFGLIRWDADTSSFIVLRGTEEDGLWIDSIKQ